MNGMIFRGLAILTSGWSAAQTVKTASKGARKVVCRDGVMFMLHGNGVSGEQACAHHCGLETETPIEPD